MIIRYGYSNLKPKRVIRFSQPKKNINITNNNIEEKKIKHPFKYDSQRKVVFLVMSCNLTPYINEEKAVKDTWANDIVNGNITNTSLIVYRGSKGKDTYYNEKEKILYINAKDDWNGTYDKTVKAFKWVEDNIEYDYIVRTNTSNYINLQSILKLINSLPNDDENIYGTRIISNNSHCGTPFLRGNCLILKKSIIKDIIKAFDKKIYHTDDSSIAYTLLKYYQKQNIDYFAKLKQFPTTYCYNKKIDIDYEFEKYKDCVDYRIKTNSHIHGSRERIINKMYELDSIIKSEENEFISPTKFNTDNVETLRGLISYEKFKNDFYQKIIKKIR